MGVYFKSNLRLFTFHDQCNGEKDDPGTYIMKLGQQSLFQLMSIAKTIDGSEEKQRTHSIHVCSSFLAYVVPSIPSQSTNSHDMNIQRTRLNRSNGHSLSLFSSFLPFDELFVRQ